MTCNHPSCDCSGSSVERNGRSYCSEACATGTTVSAGAGGGCGCGHASCGATMKLTPSANVGDGRQGGGDRAGHGVTGDGKVGDQRQREREQPGHQGSPDRSAPDRLPSSAEDEAGKAMKPGAAKPRGVDSPGHGQGGTRHASDATTEILPRATVRRGDTPSRTSPRSIEAPDARDRGI